MGSPAIIQLDSAPAGQPVLDKAKNTSVALHDVTSGPQPAGRQWSFAALIAPIETAPIIANPLQANASFTTDAVVDGGCYLVKLVRTEVTGVQRVGFAVVGVPDENGNLLPPAMGDPDLAGGASALFGAGGTPTEVAAAIRYGWAGGAESNTNFLTDAYVRWTKDFAKRMNAVDATFYGATRTTLSETDPGWFAAVSALPSSQAAIKAAWNIATLTSRPMKTPNGFYKMTDRCELVGNLFSLPSYFDGDGSTFVWAGGFDTTCKDPIPMFHFGGVSNGAIGNFKIQVIGRTNRLAEGIRVTSGGIFGPAINIIDSTDMNPIVLHTDPHGLTPGAEQYAKVSNHLINTNANNYQGDVAHLIVLVQAVDATHLTILGVAGNGAGPGNSGTIQFNIAPVAFNAHFHDIHMDGGVDYIEIPWRIGATSSTSLDANNDGNQFVRCNTNNYGNSAINIEDSQAYDQNFHGCRDVGFIGSLHGVYGNNADGVTITNSATVNVVSTSAASPVVVTTDAPHGLVTGNVAVLAGTVIGAALDGGWIVTRLTDTTYSLNDSVNPGAGGAGGTSKRQKIVITEKIGASFLPMFTRKDLLKVIEIPGVDATREDGVLRGIIVAFDEVEKTVVLRQVYALAGGSPSSNTGKVIVATSTPVNGDVIFGSQCGHRSGSLLASTGNGGSFFYFGGMTDNHLFATYMTTAQGNPCAVYNRADSEGTRRFHYHFGAGGGAEKQITFHDCRVAGIGVRKGDPICTILFSSAITYRRVNFGDPGVDTESGDGLKYDFSFEHQSGGAYSDTVLEDCILTTRRANSLANPDPLFPFGYPRFVRTKMNKAGGQTTMLGERQYVGYETPRFSPEALDWYTRSGWLVQVNGDTAFTFDEYEGPGAGYSKPRSGIGGEPMRMHFRAVADQKGKLFTYQAKNTTKLFWLGEGPPLIPCGETSSGHSEVYRSMEFWYEQNGSLVEYANQSIILAKTTDGNVVRFDFVTTGGSPEFIGGWPVPYSATSSFELIEAHAASGAHRAFWTGDRKVFYSRAASIDPLASPPTPNPICIGNDNRGTLTNAATELGDIAPDLFDDAPTSGTWRLNVAIDANNALRVSQKSMPAGAKVTVFMRARWKPI